MPWALLSVYNKTNLIPFAGSLIQMGWQLLASGSTAQALHSAQLPVTAISDYIQTPELLGGRVKTLHPAIYGGILATESSEDQKTLASLNWHQIELVVVNLYPFKETISQTNSTLAEAIEQIDIGGVALIRAGAKNYQRVNIVTEPKDYTQLLEQLRQGGTRLSFRKALASKAFTLTSQYDAMISQWLTHETIKPLPLQLNLYPNSNFALRYGENPHQEAELYSFQPNDTPLGGELLQGKALSYNNLLDLDAAWRTVNNFSEPTVCIVKHCSPCGVASAPQLSTAFKTAFACDAISAFGSILASNQTFDEATVQALDQLFIECIAAPDFSLAAQKLLSKRPRCRLLKIPTYSNNNHLDEWRSIHSGMLRQRFDTGDFDPTTWTVVTRKQPSTQDQQALSFAWKVCQHVKSNAIVLAQDQATVGIGGGQPNRLDSLHIAAKRAGEQSKGAVLASDAFFPFADSIEAAAQYGIRAIIQPGGSIRDQSIIEAADRLGIIMIFTGKRHFRH